MMPYINVDIDLSDFDTEDLVDELESRKDMFCTDSNVADKILSIYNNMTLNKDYTKELNDLIYHVLGKIV
jgi:hypothetical protein